MWINTHNKVQVHRKLNMCYFVLFMLLTLRTYYIMTFVSNNHDVIK